MSPPTVLFDLGNVLVHLDMPRGLEHLRRLAGARTPATPDQAAIFFSDLSLACNRGDLSPEAFIAALAHQLGDPPVERADLVDAWCDIFAPWPEMEAFAAEVLAAGHRAYLASNTDPLHFAYLSLEMPILQRLTGLHLSYEARAVKPDARFFTSLLARFSLKAEECLYLDDRADNVEAARSLGIRGHVHDGDVAMAREFLRESGALSR